MPKSIKLKLRKLVLVVLRPLLFLMLFIFSILTFQLVSNKRCLAFFSYITPDIYWEILKFDHKILKIHPVTLFFLLIGVIFYSMAFWRTSNKKPFLKFAMFWLSVVLVTYWISLNRLALEFELKVVLTPISIKIMLPLLFSLISVSLSCNLKWWISIPIMYMLTGPSFIIIDLTAFLTNFNRFAKFIIGFYGFHDYIFLLGLLGVFINAITIIAIIPLSKLLRILE